MWLSQEVKSREHVIVDTAREPGEMLRYLRPGEVVPPDMVLVVVNIETMHELQRIWVDTAHANEPWKFPDDANGAEIAMALLAIENRKSPGLLRQLRME